MNKIHVLLVLSLALSCIWLSSNTFSTLGAINAKNVISLYGTIQSTQGTTPVNKAMYMYGGDQNSWLQYSDQTFVANNFGLIDVWWNTNSQSLASIKSKNPNIKIIGYKDVAGQYSYDDDWNIVNSNENWFVHDANGNRIQDTQYGWYLMDIGSLGWRQHYSSYVNSEINAKPSFDGVFADDVAPTLGGSYSSTVPASVISNWHTNMVEFLQYVKANLPFGKILIINTQEGIEYQSESTDYRNAADGFMIEGYLHAIWQQASEMPSQYTINREIAALSMYSSSKIVWAESGSVSPTPDMVKSCYAMFLLGINGTNGYFGFNDWPSSDGSHGYYSIMDTNIGSPTGPYYQSQNIYIRDFTAGKVLFNPTATTYTINLGGTYKLLDGTTVTTITLNPYSGEILTK